MNQAHEILSELAARGVMIRAVGDNLRLRPADSLDAPLVEKVKAYKPELLAALRARPEHGACRYDWQPGYRGLRLTCVAHRHQAGTATVFRIVSGGDVLLEMLETGLLTGAALADARRPN